MVKVAYIVGSFPVPSQTFVANQILGVQKCGHDVTVYTTDHPEGDIPPPIDIGVLLNRTHSICPPKNFVVRFFKVFGLLIMYGWRVPWVAVRALNVFKHGRLAVSLWLLHAALTFVRIGERKYHIVHAQFGHFGLYALKLIQVGAIEGALVTSFRGYDATAGLRVDLQAYSELFRKGRLFLPVSGSVARKLIEAGCEPSKIHVLHSGIDCVSLRYSPRRRPEGKPIKLVSVGRLVEKKGITFAVEAVAKVISAGRAVVYNIVGDGLFRDDIERAIDQFDLKKSVHLLGWKSHEEVLGILEASHVLLAPSITSVDGDEEGIPNVVKEAMALGLPAISTVHAGIPELVVDGESGFLVPERSADQLAERIVYLCDHPDIWSPISRAARLKVETEFDLEKLSKDLVAIYAASLQQLVTGAPQISRPVLVNGETPEAHSNPHRSKQGSHEN